MAGNEGVRGRLRETRGGKGANRTQSCRLQEGFDFLLKAAERHSRDLKRGMIL